MNCSSESALICLPETKCACALVIVVATWTALRALVAGALTLVGLSDLVGLVRARNAHRPDSTFSIEVINTTLRSQDAGLSAQQIASGLDSVLAASR